MQERGRRSIRWRGFNYAASRAYFVTMCIHQRRCLLGSVHNGEVRLSPAGQLVESVWLRIPTKFCHVLLDSMVVMPNHVHAILRFREPPPSESLDRPTLGHVIQWWKTKTTATYARRVKTSAWPRFDGRFWQRNYYERVIRDEDELAHGRGYILRNPMRWGDDPLYVP